MPSVDFHEAEIARLRVDNRQLEATYGTGVRPEWVGEEIGMNLAAIRSHRACIEAERATA